MGRFKEMEREENGQKSPVRAVTYPKEVRHVTRLVMRRFLGHREVVGGE